MGTGEIHSLRAMRRAGATVALAGVWSKALRRLEKSGTQGARLRQRRQLCRPPQEPRLARHTDDKTESQMGLRIAGLKTLGSIGRAALGLGVAALLSGPALAQARSGATASSRPRAMPAFSTWRASADFAQKLGLKLEFVPLKTDTIGLKAAIAGELDSFEGGPGGSIVAAARGADVKIIGCSWLVVPHGVFVRDNISAMADLKGKSIAVSAPGSFPELVAKAALEQAGMAVGDVKFASMGSDTDRYKALAAGVVDGAIVSNEYLPIAAKSGIKELVAGSKAVPNFVRVCLHATGKTLSARHDDAVKFLAAEMEGLRYAMSHRDEASRSPTRSPAPRPTISARPSCSTGPSRPRRSAPTCRSRWTSSTICRTNWSRRAACRRRSISPKVIDRQHPREGICAGRHVSRTGGGARRAGPRQNRRANGEVQSPRRVEALHAARRRRNPEGPGASEGQLHGARRRDRGPDRSLRLRQDHGAAHRHGAGDRERRPRHGRRPRGHGLRP